MRAGNGARDFPRCAVAGGGDPGTWTSLHAIRRTATSADSKEAVSAATMLGELGDYELLEEIGRGGQGWYFARGKRASIAGGA